MIVFSLLYVRKDTLREHDYSDIIKLYGRYIYGTTFKH